MDLLSRGGRTTPPGTPEGQAMAQQPKSPASGSQTEQELNPEAEKASAIGKVLSAVGKALAQPEVPEMLAGMGIAFGTSPSGIKSAGARVGEQFLAGEARKRQIATQTAAEAMAGRQVGAAEVTARATASRAETFKATGPMQAEANLLAQQNEQMRLNLRKTGTIATRAEQTTMFSRHLQYVRFLIATQGYGELVTTTDDEGNKITVFKTDNPAEAQALIDAEMRKFVEAQVAAGAWPTAHTYGYMFPQDEGIEEDAGRRLIEPEVRSIDIDVAIAGAFPGTTATREIEKTRKQTEQEFEKEFGGRILYEESQRREFTGAEGLVGRIAITKRETKPAGTGTVSSPFMTTSLSKKHIEFIEELPAGVYIDVDGVLYMTKGKGDLEEVK